MRHKKRKEGGLRGLSSFKCRASKTEGEGTREEAGWKFRDSGPELFPGH